MSSDRGFLGLGLGFTGAIALSSVGLAQPVPSNIVPDETLGAERSRIINNYDGLPIEAIGGGAQRGQNLFHSFREFNINEGRGAYFAILNDSVRNVLMRVTGTNRSEILGTLGTFRPSNSTVRVSGVNVFLINPNGVVFGENSSLEVGGSFFVTTASGAKFGESEEFSTMNPQAPGALLTINPTGFFFAALQQQGSIVNQSRATQTVLGFATTGLQVPNGQSLLLLGGNVTVAGGQLQARGGRIAIGAVGGAGTVALNRDSSLGFAAGLERGNVEFTNSAQVDVRSSNGGDLGITAAAIQVAGGSQLLYFERAQLADSSKIKI